MKVVIDSWTLDPMRVVGRQAGVCYGRTDPSEIRVRRCFEAGHMSVFEHACVTFLVEGISRACSHQIVRHRMASYCQESQRYCRYDLTGDDWYVTPPRMERVEEYEDHMRDCARRYMDAVEHGVRPEDARYMLPEATKTRMAVTMNWRELFHFWDLRADDRAQWEVRSVAWAMVKACRENEDTAPMAALWEGR